MRDTFARTIHLIRKQDPRIYVVVADISPAGSMPAIREEFPRSFIDVGVAEASMIGFCAGLAMRGLKPFAYTIATFSIYRPFEMVRDDLCYQNLPVTVVGIGGGVNYSTLGGTHHAQEDIAVMSALPNMSILAPCDPLETEAATWHCSKATGPIYLRLGKSGEPKLTENALDRFEVGKIRYLRKGSDVCILSFGPIMKMALEVADRLEKAGRKTSVVSVHTLKPLDRDGIARVLATYPQVAVLEETSTVGGLAAQVKQLAWDSRARCRLHAFSLQDKFIHAFGSHWDLLKAHGLEPGALTETILCG